MQAKFTVHQQRHVTSFCYTPCVELNGEIVMVAHTRASSEEAWELIKQIQAGLSSTREENHDHIRQAIGLKESGDE